MATDKFNLSALIKRGLVPVLSANMINKVVAFFSNILIVNFLTMEEYGVWSAAFNQLSFFLYLIGLGAYSGLLQYCSETRGEERFRYARYAVLAETAADLLLTASVIVYAMLGIGGIPQSRTVLLWLSGTVVLQGIFTVGQNLLRVEMANSQYAMLLNVNSLSLSVLSCVGAWLAGLGGVIAARYAAWILTVVFCGVFCRGYIAPMRQAGRLTAAQKKAFWSFSLFSGVGSMLNSLVYLLDVTVIEFMMSDAVSVALYKTATLIPEGMLFVPNAVLTVLYPVIAAHNKDAAWVKSMTKKMLLVLGIGNAVISLGLTLFAPWIIRILWGPDYLGALAPFRILSITYFFWGTFRIPGTVILSCLRKVQWNLISGVIACVCNVVLDVVLVQLWGTVGAAVATLGVVLISSALSFGYLFWVLRKEGGETPA